MGFREWLGLSPRDAPALPEVNNNIRDSGQTFVFGRADSGERVDEKSAMLSIPAPKSHFVRYSEPTVPRGSASRNRQVFRCTEPPFTTDRRIPETSWIVTG